MSDWIPCARWSDDCQGKKDYDGRLISISTRYWPDYTANASIHIDYGEPDQYGFGDYQELADINFKGNSETDTKEQVEKWVDEQFNFITQTLIDAYQNPHKKTRKGHRPMIEPEPGSLDDFLHWIGFHKWEDRIYTQVCKICGKEEDIN